MSDVKSFWDGRAADPSLDEKQVTHPDIWQRWLEIETIKKMLPADGRLIDIGCGAGVVTNEVAPHVREALGVDYSEGMIARAKKQESIPKNVKFSVSDVLKLTPSSFGMFDVALTVRCLINLPDWPTQQIALKNIASVIAPGGSYIFVEGLKDGRAELNRLREALGLEPMLPVWHNCDFDRSETLTYLSNFFTLEDEIGFGSYDLVARVVHPLLVAPAQPTYEAKINEIAARVALERPGDMANSRVAVFRLRRR